MSVCVLASACKTSAKTELIDSPSEGRIRISVEESFKPFIEQELKVFALSFPNANIEVAYKSEIDCFKDLASDSTRMIICLLYTSPSPRDRTRSRMPSSA